MNTSEVNSESMRMVQQEQGLILHGDIQREAMREFDCCLSGEVSGGG